jgi:hypothetical protein
MFSFWKKRPNPLELDFGSEDPIGFWIWFKRNELKFHNELSESFTSESNAGDQIGKALSLYKFGLYFEIGKHGGYKFELVISADGIPEYFPAVLSLISAKPRSDLFEFTAFRQRSPDCSLNIGGFSLNPESVFFQYSKSTTWQGRLDVVLFFDRALMQKEFAIQAALLLIQACIGEYDMETMIGHVDIQDEGSGDGRELRMSTLPEIIDKEIASRAIN